MKRRTRINYTPEQKAIIWDRYKQGDSLHDIARMFIQAFIAKASVKTLNKSVLCRLAGLDKPQLHAMLKGPLIERSAGKFRALKFLSSPDSRETAQYCPEYA